MNGKVIKFPYKGSPSALFSGNNALSPAYEDNSALMILSTQSFTYDSMGNPTSYLGKTLAWEGKQLVSYATAGSGISGRLNTVTYAYDQNGLRTQKTVTPTTNATAVTTNYYYNGSVLMGMVTGSGATAIHQLFSYDASGNVVSVDYSSNGGSTFTTYYYLRNAQNDVVKLIDGSGTTVVQYTYDSWGKHIATTGTLASTVGQNQPFRYRGYVYDAETGWYYLQSRYYDPTICRFISADVLLSTGQGVLGHNAFAYCLNNPVNMSDEGGCHSRPFNTLMADSGKQGGIPYITPYKGSPTIRTLVVQAVSDLWNWTSSFHYEGRDALNGVAPDYSEVVAQDSQWILLPPSMSVYHDDGKGNPEQKFVHPDGREFVYDGDTNELVTDSEFRGTYNYCPTIPPNLSKKQSLGGYISYYANCVGHFFADMLPYYILGNDR